jgi:hypothetical protein
MQCPEFQVIERAGVNADEPLPGTSDWLGYFCDLDLRGVSTVIKYGSFHGTPLFLLPFNFASDALIYITRISFGRFDRFMAD